MPVKGLIIMLEGPDQSGKTTLALRLIQRVKAIYDHGSRPSNGDFLNYHLDKIQHAVNQAEFGHIVVLDRCYISHEVYGNLFDNGTCYDTHRMHEELLNEVTDSDFKMLLVYCRTDRKFDSTGRSELFDDSDGRVTNYYDEAMSWYAAKMTGEQLRYYRYDYQNDPNAEQLLALVYALLI